jgi:hypothetical protein
MVCLSSSAPSPIFASAYRYIGTYRYLVLNDEAGARRWFRVALEIDATHNWDAAELDRRERAQLPLAEKRARSTDTVVNDCAVAELSHRTEQILGAIIARGSRAGRDGADSPSRAT